MESRVNLDRNGPDALEARAEHVVSAVISGIVDVAFDSEAPRAALLFPGHQRDQDRLALAAEDPAPTVVLGGWIPITASRDPCLEAFRRPHVGEVVL